MIKIIALLLAWSAVNSTHAATITFPNNPRYSVDNYLVYFLRKIPLDQIQIDPDQQVIHVHGTLWLRFTELDPPMKAKLRERLTLALAGRIPVAGVTFFADQAVVRMQDLATQASTLESHVIQGLIDNPDFERYSFVIDASTDTSMLDSANQSALRENCLSYLQEKFDNYPDEES